MAPGNGFKTLVQEAKTKIKELTVEQVAEKMEKGESFFFVDTREDLEWEKGRCAGAIHLGKGVLERDIEEEIPDKNAPIVLYCGGGSRSALAALSLQSMGYKNVYSMAGGIREWCSKGLPEE